MDDAALASFPLPMATALLCAVIAVLIWRLDLGLRSANALFSAFFGLGAVTSFLVGLRFGYGFEALIPLQRTLPLLLGPMMYLGFVSLTIDRRRLPMMILLHLGTPAVLMVFLVLLAEELRNLDWIISVSYLVYGVGLYLLWRKGPDALVHARVDVTRNLSNWLLRGIGFLAFILILDTAIAIDFAVNQGVNVASLISYGTIPLVLLLLATLITLPLVFNRSPALASQPRVPNKDDVEIVAKLETLMDDHQLFLDPEITVQRLAKRLSIPARSLSGAINRTQGKNMSQYVNTFRLAYAARQLVETNKSVTKIATQSGFMARSNFYREFQRVYGQSPVAYRASCKPIKNIAL